MRLHCVAASLALSACAPTSYRRVAQPPTRAGYQHVTVHDVVGGPMLTDVNVQITTPLGALIREQACGGFLAFPLPEASLRPHSPDGIDLPVESDLMLTIPQSREAEVSGLEAETVVRVRGYLSRRYAETCGAMSNGNGRYLWIDSIERAEPTSPRN